MYNEVITLISRQYITDDLGDKTFVDTEKDVFVYLKSISQNEFYQAQANGFKPEMKFVLADYLDYSGEQLVKYTPFTGTEEVYSVVRTYRNGNELEITCKRGID